MPSARATLHSAVGDERVVARVDPAEVFAELLVLEELRPGDPAVLVLVVLRERRDPLRQPGSLLPAVEDEQRVALRERDTHRAVGGQSASTSDARLFRGGSCRGAWSRS